MEQKGSLKRKAGEITAGEERGWKGVATTDNKGKLQMGARKR
jgi:hypothetical protein